MALTLILATLAVYRLATDLAWMDGPANSYSRLRGWAATRFGPDHWVAEGVTCPICWSFWLALVAAVALVPVTPLDVWLWPLYWLGIAGATALIIRMTGDIS